jgi:hypothetical protein
MRRLAAANWQAVALEGMLGALRPAPEAEHVELAGLLPIEGTDDQLAVVLAFIEGVRAFPTLRGWPPLADLVIRAESSLRHRALRAAAESQDDASVRAIARSEWRATLEAPRKEQAYGSLALSAAADVLGEPELLERADPEVLGWRIRGNGSSDNAIDRFFAFMRDMVEPHDQPGSRTIRECLWDQREAVDVVVAKRIEPLLAWLRP